jgi:hypothetical protein
VDRNSLKTLLARAGMSPDADEVCFSAPIAAKKTWIFAAA